MKTMSVRVPRDFVEERAREIAFLRQGSTLARILSSEYERIGAAAEIAFAYLSGLLLRPPFKYGGDGGFDFVAPITAETLDVGGAQKAYNLLREDDGRPHANIAVLAQVDPFSDHYAVGFLGWEYDSVLLQAPIRQFVPNGPMNHYIHRMKLRPMIELEEKGIILEDET